MRPLRLWGPLAALLLCAGCADTGQDRVSVPFRVAGTELSGPIEAEGGVEVVVDRADLAFGPLYLCAGANAGDLCETAQLEWLQTVVVDALDPEPRRAGDLQGVSGLVLSWMYDLGLSSQLTRSDPYVLEAAETLGGASLVLEARATVDGIELPISASIPVQQTVETELGVPVVRKSTSERFNRDVVGDEAGLLARFDAAPWVRSLDLRSYVTRDRCEPDGDGTVCDGYLERTCEGATEVSTRDCQDLGEVCLAGRGCQERLEVEPDSQLFRSLRNALLLRGRAEFSWDDDPE